MEHVKLLIVGAGTAGKILVRVINYVNSVSDILSNGIINMILEIITLAVIVVFIPFATIFSTSFSSCAKFTGTSSFFP